MKIWPDVGAPACRRPCTQSAVQDRRAERDPAIGLALIAIWWVAAMIDPDGVMSMALSEIRGPALIMSHGDDACEATPAGATSVFVLVLSTQISISAKSRVRQGALKSGCRCRMFNEIIFCLT
jgi:hypothetical protein